MGREKPCLIAACGRGLGGGLNQMPPENNRFSPSQGHFQAKPGHVVKCINYRVLGSDEPTDRDSFLFLFEKNTFVFFFRIFRIFSYFSLSHFSYFGVFFQIRICFSSFSYVSYFFDDQVVFVFFLSNGKYFDVKIQKYPFISSLVLKMPWTWEGPLISALEAKAFSGN